jgi:hypothetical protein
MNQYLEYHYINFYQVKDKKEAIKLATKMIQNNVSFEFMNETEFYLTIFDVVDYFNKQRILGTEIVHLSNKAN